MISHQKNLFSLSGVTSYAALSMLFFAPLSVIAQVTTPTNPGLAAGSLIGGITSVITLLASILAVLSVLMIVISGIMYMTSLGDSARTSKAKDTLVYAVIGLIVALLAWVIVKSIAVAFGL